MRKNSAKNNRVNGEVQKALSSIIREVKDPRVSSFASVMDVYVSPDLKTCKVYVTVLGGDKERDDTLKGLNSAKGFIRRELARIVNLRNTPELTFLMDGSIEYGVDMSKKIEEVMRHDDEVRANRDEVETDDRFE
ncbi:MAG: 30S ribosome-binding factor RbfA [Lachnospiraceae bacterium]|nr:30S ribosome-binding factor RbfA [Lachnospiraceae bacterium]MCR5025773.1 30S ribosome-binding factor RbfA [Lachnospiraceae bacterium]